MKSIGSRIKVAFSLLFVVFIASSLLNWMNMEGLKEKISDLSLKKIPDINLAIYVEERLSDIKLYMTHYVLTEKDEDYEKAKAEMAKILQVLGDQDEEATKFAGEVLVSYSATMDQLKKEVDSLKENRKRASETSQSYSEQINNMISSVNGDISDLMFDEEYDEAESAIGSITILRNLSDRGRLIEVTINKALYERDPDRVTECSPLFQSIEKDIDFLERSNRDIIFKKQISILRDNVKSYKDATYLFQKGWKRLKTLEDKSREDGLLISSSVREITDGVLKSVNTLGKDGEARMSNMARVTIISLIIMVLSIFVISIWLVRSITSPLTAITNMAAQAERGSFTVDKNSLNMRRKDEIGLMNRSMMNMFIKLRDFFRTTKNSNKASSELAQDLDELAHKSSRDMSSLKEQLETLLDLSQKDRSTLERVVEAMNSISKASNNTLEMTQAGVKSSNETRLVANETYRFLDSFIDNMKSLEKGYQENRVSLQSFADSVHKISDFMSVISSIAGQTNALSINASIEAARSGIHGKGFAVVAEEVGKLADESQKASEEVEQLVELIQKKAVDTVQESATTLQTIEETSQRINDVKEKFKSLIDGIDKDDRSMTMILSLAQKQVGEGQKVAESIEDITSAVEERCRRISEIDNIFKTTADRASELLEQSENLQKREEELSRLMSSFSFE